MSIFPVTVTRDGVSATQAQMDAAFSSWFHGERLTLQDLALKLRSMCGPRDCTVFAFSRVADCMLQIARKHELIEYINGKWHIVENYAEHNGDV